MCGIFGYAGVGASLTDMEEAASLAARRGPHAWGWAGMNDSFQGAYSHHEAVPYTKSHLAALQARAMIGFRVVIGHHRLSTSGPSSDIRNLQPLHAGTVWAAHNGNVDDHRAKAETYGLTLETDNDSELLVQVLAKRGIRSRWSWLDVETLIGTRPAAILATDGESLVAWRIGLPIFSWSVPGGTFLCSVEPSRPAGLIPERSMFNVSSSSTVG